MRITRGTWYYFVFVAAGVVLLWLDGVATGILRNGLLWMAAGFFAGRCSVLGWTRRKHRSAPVSFGYTIRESHMENGVHVIDKVDLNHVSIVQEKP